MAYTPTLWAKGDKVTSAKLNKIEQGIVDKVDKETGKTLSTNDFTDAYKTKLEGIEANADKTTIDATLTSSGAAADAKATGDAIKGIETDLDGKVATIESNLDEKVENLKSLVGTPLKATTASDMTDTSKIYVYTGNESGYTNGDWYYHDGSAWVDGGTYNSVAVEVDKTLTVDGMPADAKVTGDEIGALKSGFTNLDGRFASYDESINDLHVAIGGDSEIKSSKRVSTMIGTDGSTKSETSTMHFYKFHCEGASQITFTFGTTVAGTNTHYFNQITEDGTALEHPLLMVEKGENKSVTRDILSGCTDVVISVWTDNVSCKASLNFGDNKFEKLSSDVSDLAYDVNDLSSAFGGEKVLTPISTNSIIGTDGTQKSPQAGTLEFYQFSDVSIYDSVTFTFPTTVNSTTIHWFNQIDADGNVLSHAPLSTPTGENKTNTVTLLDGCKTVKISVWVANGAWSNAFFATPKVIAKGGIYAKISALGDSITYGYSSDGMVRKTYLKQIADNFLSEYQNLGVVSTPICPNSNYTGTENQNAFVYRYSQIASDADLIIVAGGTNDFGHRVPIGTPTDGNDKFEETFYGALNYLITNIVTEHPHARLVFITPFHRDGDDAANSTGAKLIDYVNAIKDKCSTFGIACVDGYSLSGINTIAAFRSANLTDGLHPNQTGHDLIYKNLMPYFAMF